MPPRRTERNTDRATPYNLRRSNMAAAMVSPMPSWQHMPTHASGSHWPSHLTSYQPASLADYSHPLTQQSLLTPNMTAQAGPSSHNRRVSEGQAQLQPGDGGSWTAEMDNILIDAQARGLRWEQISQHFFPHKSANACRKRYGRAKEERRAADWDEARISKVIAIYNRDNFREQMWGILARETGEKWQDIEKLCFSQGLGRMTRGRAAHSRQRSRVSAGHSGLDDHDQRYNSSNDEYDPRDDSGIGLGLLTEQHHQSTISMPMPQPTVTTGSSHGQMMLAPSHNHNHNHNHGGYAYAS